MAIIKNRQPTPKEELFVKVHSGSIHSEAATVSSEKNNSQQEGLSRSEGSKAFKERIFAL